MQTQIARPLTLDEKTVNAQKSAAYYVTRVKYVSYFFMAFGAICFFSGINEVFMAEKRAGFITKEHQIPWGNKNFSDYIKSHEVPPYDDLTYIDFYDRIVNIAIVTCVISA